MYLEIESTLYSNHAFKRLMQRPVNGNKSAEDPND